MEHYSNSNVSINYVHKDINQCPIKTIVLQYTYFCCSRNLKGQLNYRLNHLYYLIKIVISRNNYAAMLVLVFLTANGYKTRADVKQEMCFAANWLFNVFFCAFRNISSVGLSFQQQIHGLLL